MPDIRPLRQNDPARIGGHRLTGVLGSGGQGVVYHGVADDGREVAIKLLHSHLSHDDDVTRGFLREVEAARRVAAFCTAAVLDVGTLDERPYIVSEYVAGDTLQALVRSAGPRTGGGLDRLAIATLTALAAIHRAGIVHRDFKPGNVLMGPEGPIVIDFGIAKAFDAGTGVSGVVGTPTYMSPEQFTGARVGPASDVFSWAGTMVFAATGRPPFAGDTVPVILNAVLSGVPDLTGVPPHLARPISACLSKDPGSRPAPADLLATLTSGAHSPAQGARGGAAHPPVQTPPQPGTGPQQPHPSAEYGTGPQRAHPGGGRETGPQQARPSAGGGKVSRRVLLGGAAATAAAAVSAFAVLRPGSGVFGADGSTRPTPTGSGRTPGPGTTGRTATAAPTGSGTASPGTPAATGTPVTATAPASPVPFGEYVVEPVALPGGSGATLALAVSGAVVACGTRNGKVFTWNLSTPPGDDGAVTRLGDGGAAVTGVACDGDRTASGHEDGRMRLWSPDAGHRSADPVLAVTLTGGKAVALSQKYDFMRDLYSVARLWDVASGKQIGKPMREHYQGIDALAFGRLDGHDVLVTGDGHNRVRVRRLSGGGVTHEFRTGDIGGVERFACLERAGRTLLVSTHLDATLRVQDLADGKRRKKWPFGAGRGTSALVAGLLGETPIAVVAHAPAGGSTFVRVWNLDTGEVVGELPARNFGIHALALADVGGRLVVAGGGEGGMLYLWSLGSP